MPATCLPASSKTCTSCWSIIKFCVLAKCLPSSSKRCQVCSSTGCLSNVGAEAIKSALIEIRNAAQAETVLNLGSDQESVVRYLTDLQQRVAEQQAEAARIVKHQKFLKVPEAVNDELGAAAEEVRLLEYLLSGFCTHNCVCLLPTSAWPWPMHKGWAGSLQGIGAALHTPWPSHLANRVVLPRPALSHCLCLLQVELRLLLWVSIREWEELSGKWRSSPFMQLDAANMEEAVAHFHKSVQRMDRGLPPNAVRKAA